MVQKLETQQNEQRAKAAKKNEVKKPNGQEPEKEGDQGKKSDSKKRKKDSEYSISDYISVDVDFIFFFFFFFQIISCLFLYIQEISKKPKIGKEESEVSNQEQTAEEPMTEAQKNLSRQPQLVTGGVLREYQLQGYEWMVNFFLSFFLSFFFFLSKIQFFKKKK